MFKKFVLINRMNQKLDNQAGMPGAGKGTVCVIPAKQIAVFPV
jgi:hypothetical protein